MRRMQILRQIHISYQYGGNAQFYHKGKCQFYQNVSIMIIYVASFSSRYSNKSVQDEKSRKRSEDSILQ